MFWISCRRMSNSVDAVRDTADPALASGFTRLVDNLLTVISDVAPAAELQDTTAFQARIAQHRRRLAAARTSKELIKEADECTITCEQYFRRSGRYYTDREAEFTEIITILREAVALMAGDASAFTAQVLSSSEGLSALTRLDDIRVLKQQIIAQVNALKRAVQDKQVRDAQAYQKLTERVAALQDRLVEAEEEAALDPLTRVANRGSFDRALRRMVANARHAGVPLSLALLDIDNFKTINDTHGHPVGDRVLLCAAMWLGKEIRHTDFLARYGGEEFAVVFFDAKASRAETRLMHVIGQIAGNSYDYDSDGRKGTVHFTMSCGLTELASGDEDADLLRRADEALYEAKHKGKNRVVTRRRSILSSLLG
jgi:diguanylate cyclase